MPWRRHRSAAGRRSAGAACRCRRRRTLGVHRWPGRWPRGSRGGCRRSCRWRILGLRGRAEVIRGRAEVTRSQALSVQLGGWCEPQVVDGVVLSEKVWSGCGGRSRIVCIMPAERVMPTEESQDLIDLTREIGGGQPYEVYLQVVEEIASAWMSVAVGVSVHSLTCFPVAEYGSDRQRADLLPAMLSGQTLGAYCLSEAQAGSDVSAISTRAKPTPDGSQYAVSGTKAWISHAGHADFYTAFVRTDDHPSKGLSCFVIPAGTDGITFGTPERKMGLACDTVRQVHFDHAVVDSARMIGTPGLGMSICLLYTSDAADE